MGLCIIPLYMYKSLHIFHSIGFFDPCDIIPHDPSDSGCVNAVLRVSGGG